jgi:lipid A ethanolaminephosphotransferase
VIAFLESQSDRYQVAMLYVSDHGESLGESGLYLHGYPYALAPREQTEVPMLLWASAGFYSDQGIDQQCLQESATEPVSHDFVFHTLLPIFRVSSSLYRPELDLLAKCRRVPTVHHPGY